VVLGLGIDLVETARLARALARTAGFEARVFTEGERADCAARGDRVQALAVRFAAKEACMKALGTGWSGGVGFQQIEVVRGPGGPPSLRLHGAAAARAASLGVTRVHVSLTHQASAAVAVVVLEGG
jgi:holo-[acyl-carrier protein] synthase